MSTTIRSLTPETSGDAARAESAKLDPRGDARSADSSKLILREDPRVSRSSALAPRSTPAAWLVAPTLLAATATGILLVMRGPDRFFGTALAILFALALLWILISVFFPAAVERTCPKCGRESLNRLDQDTTRGVICTACAHADPDQSSFLFAEEEGTLASIVLAEREAARKRAGRGGSS